MKYVVLKFQNWLFDKHFRFISDCSFNGLLVYIPFVDLFDKWLVFLHWFRCLGWTSFLSLEFTV